MATRRSRWAVALIGGVLALLVVYVHLYTCHVAYIYADDVSGYQRFVISTRTLTNADVLVPLESDIAADNWKSLLISTIHVYGAYLKRRPDGNAVVEVIYVRFVTQTTRCFYRFSSSCTTVIVFMLNVRSLMSPQQKQRSIMLTTITDGIDCASNSSMVHFAPPATITERCYSHKR